LIIAPGPVGDARIGGIATFIQGFVACMPADFEVEIVGCAVGDEMPVGKWRDVALGGKEVRLLPVARLGAARRSGKVPAKARIFAGIVRHRQQIATTGRVIQIHSPGIQVALAGRHAPLIRVVHNSPHELVTSEESAWRHIAPALYAVEHLTLRRAAETFFVRPAGGVSGATSTDHETPTKAHFLPIGVDSTLFRPLPAVERATARERFAAELGISRDDRWLLFAGRLDPQKDPELLLRAFNLHVVHDSSNGRRSQLLIIGDGRLRPRLEVLARDLGIAGLVKMAGTWPQAQLAELMAACDAFVLTSVFESGPFVVLEALASGLPVVSTCVGTVPAVIEHGVTGWITAARSPAELARGIAWAFDQPQGQIRPYSQRVLVTHELRTVLEPFYAAHRRLSRVGLDLSGMRSADRDVLV
jgi:glycosyltransferase involved in cell wall biosynthesis